MIKVLHEKRGSTVNWGWEMLSQTHFLNILLVRAYHRLMGFSKRWNSAQCFVTLFNHGNVSPMYFLRPNILWNTCWKHGSLVSPSVCSSCFAFKIIFLMLRKKSINIHPRKLEKEEQIKSKVSRSKQIQGNRTEINEIEIRKTIEKNHQNQNWFFTRCIKLKNLYLG